MTDSLTPTLARPDRASADREPPRLDYLDGLRALAALFVVMHHSFQEVVLTAGRFPQPLSITRPLLDWLQFGRVGVNIFIVLSGYVLMLPVSRAGSLRGGLIGFARRRARRILPPYYAALALSWLLLGLTPLGRPAHFPNHWTAQSLPAFGALNVVSHLLLIHNLWSRTVWTINSPLWSVATEWQLYFAFALILLPVWKRFGQRGALVASVVCYALIVAVTKERLCLANFQLVILFAMGMAATSAPRQVGRVRPWAALALATTGVYWALTERGVTYDHTWMDGLAGIATAGLLVWMRDEPLSAVRRFLGSRAPVAVGRFSYSLYLTHWLVVGVVGYLLMPLGTSLLAKQIAMFALVIPAALGLAYLFHLAFERPFLSASARGVPAAHVTAHLRATDTAPASDIEPEPGIA